MRTIFEAIVFLNLKNEDRIGHAVALGIDPKLFLNSRRAIVLTKGEYLDNLLFMYFLLSQRDDSPISLEMLKNKIYRLSSKIYNHSFKEKGYKVDDYIDAWLLRRNCPNEIEILYNSINKEPSLELFGLQETKLKEFEEKRQKVNNNKYSKVLFLKEFISEVPDILDRIELRKYENIFLKNALPDFFDNIDTSLEPLKRYLKAKNNPNAFEIYEQYNFDPKVAYRSKQVYTEDPTFDIDVYEYMQDLVMEDVIVKKDIIIEILPTSNVLITSIGSFDNHPFIRLNPPKEIVPNRFGIRKGKIKLLLGTDDPGIQGTNLMMEVYHIKNLVTKKFDKKVAESYILEILKFGNYIFNKK